MKRFFYIFTFANLITLNTAAMKKKKSSDEEWKLVCKEWNETFKDDLRPPKPPEYINPRINSDSGREITKIVYDICFQQTEVNNDLKVIFEEAQDSSQRESKIKKLIKKILKRAPENKGKNESSNESE